MHSIAPLEQAGIPLPAPVAAIWGGFLYEGLLASSSQDQGLRERAILDAWGLGCLELVSAACSHLPEVWEQITEAWTRQDVDFPGVFEYEVVASLGTYFGDYLLDHGGKMPDRDLVSAKIQNLIIGFFASGQPQHLASTA